MSILDPEHLQSSRELKISPFCEQQSPMFRELLPERVRKLALHQSLIWGAGFATCLSLFVDDARRRAELAAYVLPKGMEVSICFLINHRCTSFVLTLNAIVPQSAWSIARQRSWVPFVPGGDLLLTSVGMSLVMGTYAQHPEQLSGLVRRVIYQVSPTKPTLAALLTDPHPHTVRWKELKSIPTHVLLCSSVYPHDEIA